MIAPFFLRNWTFYFKCSPITQKLMFSKFHTYFYLYSCRLREIFFFFQIQICVSYTACRRAPQIQHASQEWLQRRYFALFMNKYFFWIIKDMVNNIFEYNYLRTFPSIQKKIAKTRFILDFYSGITPYPSSRPLLLVCKYIHYQQLGFSVCLK